MMGQAPRRAEDWEAAATSGCEFWVPLRVAKQETDRNRGARICQEVLLARTWAAPIQSDTVEKILVGGILTLRCNGQEQEVLLISPPQVPTTSRAEGQQNPFTRLPLPRGSAVQYPAETDPL